MLKRYSEFINETIKWFSSEELLTWLEERRDMRFIALDTETTGLRGPKEEQLTQIAAVAFSFDYDTLTFTELGQYNEKIKLSPEIIAQKDLPGSRVKEVLKLTRYGVGGGRFVDEQAALNNLQNFVDGYEPAVLLIQNAKFDMKMINIRKAVGGLGNEIFDTMTFWGYFLLPTLQSLAQTDPEAKKILDIIGSSKSGKLPTSSLPNVAKGLGTNPEGAHDALFDCRYMVKTLEKGLEIIKNNMGVDRKEFLRPRISTERYYKMKD
jgi:DNA polymerase III epsilon subunit-like protein